MAKNHIKSIIISYDKLSDELKAKLSEKYPEGYRNFVIKYPKPNGDFFYAVSLETGDTNYLVKVDVRVDSVFSEQEFEKEYFNLEGEEPDFIKEEVEEDIDTVDESSFRDDVDLDPEE